MSDFAINGVINVVTTGVDKALAEVEAVEARLKSTRGNLVQEIIDGADVDRVKAINREVNAIDRELKDVKLLSRAVTYNLEGMDPALRKALISADKFNRVSQNMVDNFKGGNFGDPQDLQYFRELARSADGLEDMRRALAAAEITGATVPQSLRRVVQEADKFEESFGRAVQSMKDFDAVNATRGMDELTRAMVRYGEAEARRDQANRDAGNDALPHHQRKAAADSIARLNNEMLDAERDFIRESDRLDAEAGRKREKADRDEMARRKANAQAQAMIAREEIAANKARVDAENARITEQARFRVFEARQEAAAREAREKFLAQDEAYHERVSNLQRNLGYAQMAETESQEAVSRTRLADATRDATRAQTAYNAAREAGDEDGMVRAHKLHTDAIQRQVSAQNDLSRAVQFNNGLASQNRYAMYDVAQTYGLLAAAGAATIGGLGFASGWWESQMTGVARTAGLGTFDPKDIATMGVLERQLIRMSDVIPTWVGNITDIARVGGQLGVEADNLAEFTGAVAQFTAVSDVSDIDQAAEAFGRIRGLTGAGFREIADAVSNVGINAAATDAQILKTTQELAQAGAGANFSAKELIGMAGGFASLGVPAERSRSVMQDFVRIATGGLSGANDSMEKFAGHMGITVDQAKTLFRQNPAQFLQEFAKGLAGLSPEEIVTALQDIGLKGQRASPVFQALAKDANTAAGGLNIFGQAIEDALNSEGALTSQFSPMLDDLATTWQRFLNTFTTTAATTGSGVAPVLGGILEGATDIMKGWRSIADTGIGQGIISVVSTLGALGTAAFGIRAGVAGMAGMSLALKSVKDAAGGSFLGQLKMAASTFIPFSMGADAASRSTNKLGAESDRAGRAVFNTTGRVVQARAQLALANGEITRTARNMTMLRGAAMNVGAAMAPAAGPLGLVAAAAAVVQGGFDLMSKSGSTATSELTALMATSKKIAPIVEKTFSRDIWGHIGNAAANMSLALPAQLLAQGIGTMIRQDNPFDVVPTLDMGMKYQTGNFFEWLSLSPTQRQSIGMLDDLGTSIGELASYDLPAAQKQLRNLQKEYGYTDAEMMKFINSNDLLKGSLLDAATMAGVNVGALETLAEKQALLDFSLGQDAAGVDGTVIAGLSEELSLLQAQSAARRDNLTTLNASTSAMGGYYQAMEGIGDAVTAYTEKYGAAVDLWDESKGMWNITNSDTAALALTFEDLAANTLSVADAMIDAGLGVDAANMYIESAADAVTGYLEAMGHTEAEIAQILDSIGLVPLETVFNVSVNGAEQAVEGIEGLIAAVEDAPDGAVITVDALTDEAIAQLSAAGVYARELSDGTYELYVSVDTGDATTDILALMDIRDSLGDGESAQIHIQDPTPEVIDYINRINGEIDRLDDGTIVVTIVTEGEIPVPGGSGPVRLPVEVEWDFQNADLSVQTLDKLQEIATTLTIPIQLVPDFSEVEGAASIIAGYYNGVTGTVEINADVMEALKKIDGLSIYINGVTGEIMVVANDEQAKEDLENFLANVEGRSANVHFNPDMDDVLEAINEATKSRDVEVEGIPQMSAAERAITRTSRPRPMTITANANVGEAERLLNRTARNRPTNISVSVSGGAAADGYLNSIARDRTSTITVNVNTNHHTTYSSSGSSGGGQSPIVTGPNSADGGYTGAGPKWAFAGNVHAGEYVIPKRDVDQTTGLPRADALARLMGQAGAMGGPQVIVQQGSGGGIMELGPTSIHALARAVQPMLKMDSSVIAQGVSSQFANNTRKGAY